MTSPAADGVLVPVSRLVIILSVVPRLAAKFPGRILDLDYKALTEDQENQSRMLLEHCGLPWQDQCLEFYKTKRGVLTASQTQVREQMYQGSSDAWKKYRKYIPDLLEELDKAGIKYG